MNEKKDEFDIFIAKSIYPEAQSIFTFHLKSVEDIKDDCIFVIDTNALLVPYTISKESLEQIHETYSALVKENRLIIPGHVAREFAKNRATKIAELYQQLSRQKSVKTFQTGSYPLLDAIPEYQEVISLEQEINNLIKGYKKSITKVLDHISGWTWNDPISLIYGELFIESVILDLDLVLCQFEYDGYNRFNRMRASPVVKCQSTVPT